jgi:hypothetical protein
VTTAAAAARRRQIVDELIVINDRSLAVLPLQLAQLTRLWRR